MKLTKRILCLALALALTFALSACGKNDDKKETNNTTQPVSSPSDTQTTVDEWQGNLGGENQFNDATFAW